MLPCKRAPLRFSVTLPLPWWRFALSEHILLTYLRLSSSRAFGHIGQQLGAILNGQLQYIQPPPTWSRPSANPAGEFCSTSSWGVLFYACHPLETRILPLSGKRSTWPAIWNLRSVTLQWSCSYFVNIAISNIGLEWRCVVVCRQYSEHCSVQLLWHHNHQGDERYHSPGPRRRPCHYYLGRVAWRWLATVRLQVTYFYYLGRVISVTPLLDSGKAVWYSYKPGNRQVAILAVKHGTTEA